MLITVYNLVLQDEFPIHFNKSVKSFIVLVYDVSKIWLLVSEIFHKFRKI